jgi:hypothetical protein
MSFNKVVRSVSFSLGSAFGGLMLAAGTNTGHSSPVDGRLNYGSTDRHCGNGAHGDHQHRSRSPTSAQEPPATRAEHPRQREAGATASRLIALVFARSSSGLATSR